MIRFLLLSALALGALGPAAVPAAAKYAHILIDAGTGKTLDALNADTRNYPASLTKMMTLFMTFEALRDGRLKPSQKLRVSHRAQSRPPSRLGLRAGQTISVRNAVSALVVKSANDAATVVAEALGGTERKFALQMTRRARALGMRSTTFRNASGLPNRGQLSTARDMATLGRRILRDFPDMYDGFSRRSWTWRGRTYRNHNRLLGSYRGADGIKTGYIRASGYNLVASAERDGRRLIAVVFGGRTSKSRNRIVARLLDRGFAPAGPAAANSPPGTRSARSAVPAPRPRVLPEPRRPAAAGKVRLAHAPGRIRSWTVQVGAFRNYADARRMLDRAVRRVPSLAGGKFKIVTRASRSRRGKLYQPRLVMASQSKARDSCRVLKRRKVDCLVIWMGPRR